MEQRTQFDADRTLGPFRKTEINAPRDKQFRVKMHPATLVLVRSHVGKNNIRRVQFWRNLLWICSSAREPFWKWQFCGPRLWGLGNKKENGFLKGGKVVNDKGVLVRVRCLLCLNYFVAQGPGQSGLFNPVREFHCCSVIRVLKAEF
jgi:hypothetical protein